MKNKIMHQKNILLVILFVLFFLFFRSSYAQISHYIVITFEYKRSIDKQALRYYWITPVDSIRNTDFRLYPLYLAVGEFSKDNLDNCMKGDTIDIFTGTTKTMYNFGREYEFQINRLISLIDNNRTRVQTIKTHWSFNGRIKPKDIINIFATPISGEFCYCFQYHNYGGDNFQSYIYLPSTNFDSWESFWQTPKASTVKFSNYGYVDFKSHLLLSKGVQWK